MGVVSPAEPAIVRHRARRSIPRATFSSLRASHQTERPRASCADLDAHLQTAALIRHPCFPVVVISKPRAHFRPQHTSNTTSTSHPQPSSHPFEPLPARHRTPIRQPLPPAPRDPLTHTHSPARILRHGKGSPKKQEGEKKTGLKSFSRELSPTWGSNPQP